MEKTTFISETSSGMNELTLDGRLLTDRRVFITEPITMETAVSFMQKMMFLESSDEPIDIYINCEGGEVTAGLYMYDIICGCENEINMYCTGRAYSMAAVLLAAGQQGRRYILPHSMVMIHEVLVNGGISGSATSVSNISKSILKTRDRVNELLAKHTGKSLREINKATSFDNFMSAEEAIKFGICDKTASNFKATPHN